MHCKKRSNDNYKIFTAIFPAIVIFIFFALPVYAFGEGADIHLIKKELYPIPARPGQDLVLSITVENWGSRNVENLTIELLPDPVITLKNENERSIQTKLCGYCKRAEVYQLRLDTRAASGVYEIEIKALADGVGVRETINVIVTGEPQLTLCNTSLYPKIIRPGDNFNLDFSVCNTGTGAASGIKVITRISDLPFVPVGTDTLIIESLSSGASKQGRFGLTAQDDTKPASYLLPIVFEYINEDGKNVSSSELLGVNILGEAGLNIAGINTEPGRIKKGDAITLMIRIENAGSGDAESVKASVNVPLKGTKTAYIGTIEPGDDAPAIFNLYADRAGDYRYNLTLQYEDDLGDHAINETLDMGVGKSNGTSTFLGILLLSGALGAYWFLRRSK